jgi:aspartate racemase
MRVSVGCKVRQSFRHVICPVTRELKEKESIQGLILGGTELPLILKQPDFGDIEIFDTTKIHVEAIVNRMIAD